MGELTYQRETTGYKLETYEWDNTWIDHANSTDRKRIFYIGDSISYGTRQQLGAQANETYYCDGFATSKGIDNPTFADSIRLFASQLQPLTCVLFNNGLHGWHLSAEEFANHYEKMVEYLVSMFKDVPLYIVLTTSTRDDEAREKSTVCERNEIALRVAKKFGLKTIDLYTASIENKELHTPDGVHFTTDGYKLLADVICKAIGE